jgi:hypothetical protein
LHLGHWGLVWISLAWEIELPLAVAAAGQFPCFSSREFGSRKTPQQAGTEQQELAKLAESRRRKNGLEIVPPPSPSPRHLLGFGGLLRANNPTAAAAVAAMALTRPESYFCGHRLKRRRLTAPIAFALQQQPNSDIHSLLGQGFCA